MRLGGFVIHGNNADTLEACLRSLIAVCDEVLAVDSDSTDGSAALVKRLGVVGVNQPWRGYGAARERAAKELQGCDYLLFLDSDERFEDDAIEAIQEWKRSSPTGPAYRLPVNDWAELPGHRFLFRRHKRVRLYRADQARWTASMVVHESVRIPGRLPVVNAPIEHRFATSLDRRLDKEDRYARLWAVRAYVEGRRFKPPWVSQQSQLLRMSLLQGAVVRGGADGWRLAKAVSQYHRRKYEYLKRIQDGEFAEEVHALRAGRYEALFR